jgi:hypothetical protein
MFYNNFRISKIRIQDIDILIDTGGMVYENESFSSPVPSSYD